MKHGIYYLTKSGCRIVEYVYGKKVKHTFKTVSGKYIKRAIIEKIYLYNIIIVKIMYKKQVIQILIDSLLID